MSRQFAKLAPVGGATSILELTQKHYYYGETTYYVCGINTPQYGTHTKKTVYFPIFTPLFRPYLLYIALRNNSIHACIHVPGPKIKGNKYMKFYKFYRRTRTSLGCDIEIVFVETNVQATTTPTRTAAAAV